MKKLILNADDFGASKEINEGIQQAVVAGRITSVSVMVSMPYYREAVAFLQQHPEVTVGLHFNLTEGISHLKLLFPGPVGLVASLIFGRLSLTSVKAELLAQYHCLQQSGLPITHLDTHENIHIVPPLFKLLLDFAEEKKISRLRACAFSVGQLRIVRAIFPTPKQLMLWLVYGVNHLLFLKNKSSSVCIPDCIFDLNWQSTFTVQRSTALLSSLPLGTNEVICHLSSVVTHDPLSYDRQRCLSFITGAEFGTILKQYHAS